jgi:hypothetical protein
LAGSCVSVINFRKIGEDQEAPEVTPPQFRYPATATGSQLGQLLRELREDKASYFGHLTSPGDRPEWALLTMDRLVRELSSVL